MGSRETKVEASLLGDLADGREGGQCQGFSLSDVKCWTVTG